MSVLLLASPSSGQEIEEENQQLISSCGDRPQIIAHACFMPRREPGKKPHIFEGPCGGPSIDEEPEILRSVLPEYTQRALDERYAGTDLVSLTLQADGTARDFTVRKPIGYGLDEKAIAAVKKFQFRPAKKDGRPVEVFAEVLVSFCRPDKPDKKIRRGA